MKLIVGLGNPGFEYQLTPHNLGFLAVDRLAELCGVETSRREAQALTASTEIEGVEVVLAKPQTYMNLSGMAVARLLDRYSLEPPDLLVLVDDADLPFGMLRIRQRGSAGSHNGLKSIIGALQSDDFGRIRMGVQPVSRRVEDLASHVLGRFRRSDLETVADILDQATEAVRIILKEGISRAMNRFNRRVPSSQS
ncbi:MAG TPA: aminoacyl-tRNA hydrolase [Terriglobia bacterium]|nr:aminoacyl-tRNA hydrolase [Terriglobia bacterium]